MSSVTHGFVFADPGPPASLERDTDSSVRLTLVPNGDGWALARRDGIFLFQAPGVAGRQRCLEFARDRGVLALFS